MRVYDKLDWHLDAALRAGQPEENAFSHIGLYLGWLVRKNQTESEFIRPDWVEAIKRGEMTGSDLSGAVDGVLASDMLTAEGRAFTDYYYPTYLSDYGDTFSESGDYAVADDSAAYSRIAPVIERRYSGWVSDGRPSPPDEDIPGLGVPPDVESVFAALSANDVTAIRSQIESMVADLNSGQQPDPVSFPRPTSQRAQSDESVRELEQIAAGARTEAPRFLQSRSAAEWGDPLLRRALKRLNVKPAAVMVTTAMWSGPAVMLYMVPGVDSSRLAEEFATAIHLPPRGRWESAAVAGKSVHLARGKEFTVAYWVARHDLVVHVAVPDPAVLEEIVARLP